MKNLLIRRKWIYVLTSITLVIAVCVSQFSGLLTFAGGSNVWDGSISASLEGEGNESSPYIIKDGADLAFAITSGGNDKYYKLTADIYLNDLNNVNWSDGTVNDSSKLRKWYTNKSGGAAYMFSGTIDGDGHIIYGLYGDNYQSSWGNGWTPSDGVWGAGFISFVPAGKSVTLKNLGFDNVYFHAGTYAGVIGSVASTATVKIEQCYVGANGMLKAAYSGSFVGAGASISKTDGITITNSYSLLTNIVSKKSAARTGFTGGTWFNAGTVRISNSYAVGSIVSAANGETATNCYSQTQSGKNGITNLTATQMQGESAKTNMASLDFDNVFATTDGYPMLQAFIREELPVWDGSVSASLEGDGTETSPFIINNGADLAYAITGGGNDKYYKLTADIYLNDLNNVNWINGSVTNKSALNVWKPGAFSGTIDGDGHVIYGLYNDYYTTHANGWNYWIAGDGAHSTGFITKINGGKNVTLKNLGFDNFYFHSPTETGIIAFAASTATLNIDKCYVGANGSMIGAAVGPFLGAAAGYSVQAGLKISNSYSLLANVTSKKDGTEGLLGSSWYSANGTGNATVKNCYAVGKIVRATNEAAENCYSQLQANRPGVTTLTEEQMKGENAKISMSALDFDNVFKTGASYPSLSVFSETSSDGSGNDDSYWNGSISTSLEGEGTAETPFLIKDGADLAFAITNGGNDKYYKLTADIYLNDINNVDWSQGTVNDAAKLRTWRTNKSNGAAYGFSGTIDGDGHVIYGLYANNYQASWGNGWTPSNGDWGAGLISFVPAGKTATLKNLGFDNFYIHAGTYAGLVGGVAASASVNIEKCYVGANGTLKAACAGTFVGAGAGLTKTDGITIDNSYSLLTNITSKKTPGRIGFTGGSWLGSGTIRISNSYAIGIITSAANGENANNCYSQTQVGKLGVTKLTLEQMQGESAKTNMSELDWKRTYVTTNTYPTLYIFAGGEPEEEPEGDIWSGRVAESFAGGKGTSSEPYLIENGAQLAKAVTENGLNGSYFKLTKDIYLNNTNITGWEHGEGLNYWYTDNSGFKGHLDGDGHIVNGILYKETVSGNRSGLIPLMLSGSVRNIGVRNSFVYAGIRAGGIVGEAYGPDMKIIDKCFVDESVVIKFMRETTGGAAGIVGYADNSANETVHCLAISNCYSKAQLDGYQAVYRCNGILGTSWRCGYTMEDCYSIGYAPYRGDGKENGALSGLVSTLDGKVSTKPATEVYKDVYTDSDEPKDKEHFIFISDPDSIRGEAAKTAMSGLDFASVFETVSNGTPKLKIFTQISGEDVNVSPFSGGKGSKNDPYIITTAEQLRLVVESPSTKGRYYKLGNDIYVNDTTNTNWKNQNPAEWYSKKSDAVRFMGNFDGCGYKIYGLYINETPAAFPAPNTPNGFVDGGAGLFPYVGIGAVIRNVHIRDSYISAYAYAGGIIGFIPQYSEGYITVAGCSVDESVTVKAQTAGGLVGGGLRGLKLHYSYSLANISSNVKDRTNALIGDIWTNDYEICECYSVGYKGFRAGFAPLNFKSVYGTHEAAKTKVLTISQMTGTAAKNNMPDFDWDKAWYVVDGKTPQLKIITEDMTFSFTDEGVKGRVWSGKAATKFSGGSGTENDPYLIETPEQLAMLVKKGNSSGKYYKLIADIKLNDTSKTDWKSSANEWFTGYLEFGGHFDGNGHIVSGLYINSDGTYAALFPMVSYNASISKLGIVNSYIYNTGSFSNYSYSAAFVGYVNLNSKAKDTRMKMSECFADDSVFVYGFFSGGLICGCPQPVELENCYYTGALDYEDRCGGLIGNCWIEGSLLTNCYTNTENRDNVCGGAVTSRFGETTYINVYADYATSYNQGVTKLSLMNMKGSIAKEKMLGFDFNKVWKTVKDGTPVLRAFENSEQYTCTRDAVKSKIYFSTNGGENLEPISGYPTYTKIDELPTPVRKGYIFGGWYVYPDLDVPFSFEVFPNYDLYVYAKWVSTGFVQNFDGEVNETYDFNSSVQLYKPGVMGYNPLLIKSGIRSVHTLAEATEPALFLLSYQNKLEIGKEYEVSFYVSTDTDGASATLELLHANHPQIDSDIVGYQKVADIGGLEEQQWKKYTFKFVANSKYAVFRVSQGASLYFDDFEVVMTGKDGKLGEGLNGYNPSNVDNGLYQVIWPYVLAGAIGLILIAGAVTVIVVIRRKKVQ